VGTRDVLPARSSWFMPADIELRLGHPVPVDGLTARDRPALTARLEEDVRNLLAGPAVGVDGGGSSAT
jgi:hypothetical protein